MAAAMKRAGELPAGLSLWAVENPMVHKVDRLHRKVGLAAQPRLASG